MHQAAAEVAAQAPRFNPGINGQNLAGSGS
jgi:hypothetical protein